MEPHRIRLRDPWIVEPPNRHRRKFGKPTNIDTSAVIVLMFTGMSGTTRIELNGAVVGEFDEPSFEIDVTKLLQSRNELMVETDQRDEVSIEIR